MTNTSDLETILHQQRAHFNSGVTRDVAYRVRSLKSLKRALEEHEEEIYDVLNRENLGKARVETYLGEIAGLIGEIDYAAGHVRSWAKPKRVKTAAALQPASSHVYPEPLGVVLILGAWNYPIQLVLGPWVAALAAGNCAVLKPSELAPASSALMKRILDNSFDPGLVTVVEGGVELATQLLEHRFDHIFFTGGTAVGRVIAQAAAKTLTPVTLELGGKSPCIVDHDIDVAITAKRIAWGKFFNAGQSCIAPDYLLVDRAVKPALLEAMTGCIRQFYGDDPRQSPDYGRIVNKRHFDRLCGLLGCGEIITGGQVDPAEHYIAPTIIGRVALDDPIMEAEIFGPILPVIEFTELTQAVSLVNSRPKPLALYLFSRDREVVDRVLRETSAGGGTINDTLLHVSSQTLPFGGVGESGSGRYHGKAGFDSFSNHRAILKKGFSVDPPFRYPPYGNRLPWIKRLMKYFG